MLESNSSGSECLAGAQRRKRAVLSLQFANQRCAPGKRNAENSGVWGRAPVWLASRYLFSIGRSGFLCSDAVQFAQGITMDNDPVRVMDKSVANGFCNNDLAS